ncbi:TFIIH complex serine/threonine-protein kinase subunit kin28 [Coniosporium apollinis]|uniref:TFIIH complex serine/threonine-protein kinase subunit kin28 n=2 Tax=Coniosporium TaxID=2810619 RepID=A0ABQ9NP82_9PEZI|nr:TFIIH complex serine/threonine-protein kinase subunit kin28 [Cladosporium sp. JES 115]KAJ9663402.1 TFIIH complex serine/threonine-protein kinase subunit kin28 [Coniosporium apollinis]
MALSPAEYKAASADNNAIVAKAKALTILSNNANSKPTIVTSATKDLSEQLNEETRNRYEKGKKLGEGTYAVVFKGHLKSDPASLVAIKKIKINANYKDGLAMDAIREIKFLQELSHPNIIALHAVFTSKNLQLNLVLEFLPRGDLEMLIRDPKNVHYGLADIKAWMAMLSRAVYFCHQNFVLHRDIKPNNLLIAEDGEVKLADFGLARSFADPYEKMTHEVITRWYRPLELLYKARHYSGAIDVWSVGTVFAELILRQPWLMGTTDIDQIHKICENCGTPLEENWPGVSKLENYVPPAPSAIHPIPSKAAWLAKFGTVGPQGVDLLRQMLVLDPSKRITARGVLEHEWWTSDPRPTKKEQLPKKGGGEEKMGEDLKRTGRDFEADGRVDKVARKLFP